MVENLRKLGIGAAAGLALFLAVAAAYHYIAAHAPPDDYYICAAWYNDCEVDWEAAGSLGDWFAAVGTIAAVAAAMLAAFDERKHRFDAQHVRRTLFLARVTSEIAFAAKQLNYLQKRLADPPEAVAAIGRKLTERFVDATALKRTRAQVEAMVDLPPDIASDLTSALLHSEEMREVAQRYLALDGFDVPKPMLELWVKYPAETLIPVAKKIWRIRTGRELDLANADESFEALDGLQEQQAAGAAQLGQDTR
jgi:hypothetical protein